MFTGIITDVGRVRSVETNGDTRLVIETAYDTNEIDIGASIACAGPCLTVTDKDDGWFAVDASAETLSKTTLGGWAKGTRVNLERALRVGDEMGGHIVTGHVDGIAVVISVTPEGDSQRFVLEAPNEYARYVAPKGSVTLDGVSLTVNEVDGSQFGVNIIPHTQAATTFGDLQPGDRVNFEIDVLARYVDRLRETL
ncbi:MAG: riboflavin synthase [Alphaproteobacteria bacterium]